MNVVLVGGHDRQNTHYIKKLSEIGISVKRVVESKSSVSVIPTSGCDAVLVMRDICTPRLKAHAESAASEAGLPLVRVASTMTKTKQALIKSGLYTLPNDRIWNPERLEEASQLRKEGLSYGQIADRLGVSASAANSALRRLQQEEEANAAREAARRLEELEDELETSSLLVAKLEKRLSESAAWAKALEEENKELSGGARLDELKAELAGANSRAEMAEARVSGLVAEVDSLRRSREAISKQAQQSNDQSEEVERLHQLVTSLESSRSSLQDELTAERMTNSELWQDVQELQGKAKEAEKTRELQAELGKARKDLKARTDACTSLKAQLDKAAVEISAEESRLRAEVIELKKALKKASSAKPASKDEIKKALLRGIKIGKSGDDDILEILDLLT